MYLHSAEYSRIHPQRPVKGKHSHEFTAMTRSRIQRNIQQILLHNLHVFISLQSCVFMPQNKLWSQVDPGTMMLNCFKLNMPTFNQLWSWLSESGLPLNNSERWVHSQWVSCSQIFLMSTPTVCIWLRPNTDGDGVYIGICLAYGWSSFYWFFCYVLIHFGVKLGLHWNP